MTSTLNQTQQAALAAYLTDTPEPGGEQAVIGIDRGQLTVNGLYLHADGEWATFPEVAS